MSADWKDCKRILCIRPDNMGDLLMTTPALLALKETFGAHITMLTSSMATGIAHYINEIDEVITFDVPWVKAQQAGDEQAVLHLLEQIRNGNFDAAIIFTVYSQNPMPTLMLAYLAGIPLRLAYCRENPYHLLTHWVPDEEPYTLIKHQVRRDLDLIASVGATPSSEKLNLRVPAVAWPAAQHKLQHHGFNLNEPWLLMHTGVSESKRQYPVELWAEAVKEVINVTGYQVLLTGSAGEAPYINNIYNLLSSKQKVFPVAGMFELDEFISLIMQAPVIISVNTGTIHIAAAVGTPVVVLYALTNPQHTPWMVPCQVLSYPVPPEGQSKNEVIRYVNRFFEHQDIAIPSAQDVVAAVQDLMAGRITTADNGLLSIGFPHVDKPYNNQRSIL